MAQPTPRERAIHEVREVIASLRTWPAAKPAQSPSSGAPDVTIRPHYLADVLATAIAQLEKELAPPDRPRDVALEAPGRGDLVIRFDGPPGPTAGRFVEVERDGRSVKVGRWCDDGEHWLLVIDRIAALAFFAAADEPAETPRITAETDDAGRFRVVDNGEEWQILDTHDKNEEPIANLDIDVRGSEDAAKAAASILNREAARCPE